MWRVSDIVCIIIISYFVSIAELVAVAASAPGSSFYPRPAKEHPGT